MSHVILIIDDNEGVRTALSVLFDVHDLPSVTAGSVDEGLQMLDEHPVGLVVQDMNFTSDTTSGKEGIELFHALRDRRPDLPIILLTAWTHLETAVELVRVGAADYLSKPWDDEKLVTTARNLLELSEANESTRRAVTEKRERRQRLAGSYDLCGVVYESNAMHDIINIATRIAASDVPVLITGPNGAGKEKLADIVHANSSVAAGPFVKLNVGALPAELMESELFGAEAGAFTGATKARVGRFEAADGGTLFLDEIGNLSLDGQAKLLRVLQTGEFQRLGSSETRRSNVRVLSATNVNLPTEVAAGRFREDLYYRLNVIELDVPALVQRREDILPLSYFFLGSGLEIDPGAEDALLSHGWAGNVRELQNSIRRASLLCSDKCIRVQDLALPDEPRMPAFGVYPEPSESEVRLALDQSNQVVSKAARRLGISRQALYRRMEKFGIQK